MLEAGGQEIGFVGQVDAVRDASGRAREQGDQRAAGQLEVEGAPKRRVHAPPGAVGQRRQDRHGDRLGSPDGRAADVKPRLEDSAWHGADGRGRGVRGMSERPWTSLGDGLGRPASQSFRAQLGR